ncbi:MAG: helix-hairpin-helix domain-containing protein [Bacteroidaceae bacterium]|nr:helix-hairpin-helix domain-containing protein [Bacteroidaceae bacterium]
MKQCACLLILCIALCGGRVCAQSTLTWQDFVEEISDDAYAEEQGWTEHMEELAELAAHPLDINTATREQLNRIPFLSEEQIEEILDYIFLHQGMRSTGELMAISSIDFTIRRYLSLFVYADQSVFLRPDTLNLKSLVRKSKHELLTRLDIPLYYRAGYSYPPERGGYHGSTLYNKVRYQMTSQKHLDLGLSAEKDQGEPFRHNGGWDSYGLYLLLRDIGHLRTAIVGDYKMAFGEGLVVNSGFSTGKSSLMSHPSQGIKSKRGMDEVNYFRGAAATVRVGHTDISAWLSHRRLDATLNDDGAAVTLQTSGLHRTTTELDHKRNLASTLAGGNLTWRNHGFHLGATGYFQRFHRELSPGDALYRKIYPEGRNFGAMSLDYGYAHPWISLSGETAYSTEKGGLATLNRVSWKISPQYTLSGSYRFYSYKYYSFHASALAENSRVQNESGGMLRLDARPFDPLTLVAYIDFFYNPWPRYTMTHSSSGQDLTLKAEYQLGRQNTLGMRYQLKRKERSDHMQVHNRLRIGYTRQQGTHWRLQSQLHLHAMDGSGVGYALSQRVRYQKGGGQLSALLSYFDTPDYETRIFQYEPMLSEMFRYPSLYGRGLRFVAAARYALWKGRLTLEALYGMTRYTDRDEQSSGMQLIHSPWKNDLSVQIRLKI